MNDTQFESGVLTYVTENAFGEMKDLLDDLGIKKDSLLISNVAELTEQNENYMQESDPQLWTLLNSRFTTIDMTDYDANFSGYNELGRPI